MEELVAWLALMLTSDDADDDGDGPLTIKIF
jgi:hypothetical protein